MPTIDWTAEADRKLLILLEPPTLRDRQIHKAKAQYLATMFAGASYKTITKRVVQLRGELKQVNMPLTAPGQLEEPRTPCTNAAAAAAAAERNLPPPGAPTPTFPRGPRSPKEFRSPMTGEWFTISAAPKSHKRARSDDDDQGAPKRLRWNIHDDYAGEYREMARAASRADVLESIGLDNPEIINLDSPSFSADSASTTSTLDRP